MTNMLGARERCSGEMPALMIAWVGSAALAGAATDTLDAAALQIREGGAPAAKEEDEFKVYTEPAHAASTG